MRARLLNSDVHEILFFFIARFLFLKRASLHGPTKWESWRSINGSTIKRNFSSVSHRKKKERERERMYQNEITMLWHLSIDTAL